MEKRANTLLYVMIIGTTLPHCPKIVRCALSEAGQRGSTNSAEKRCESFKSRYKQNVPLGIVSGEAGTLLVTRSEFCTCLRRESRRELNSVLFPSEAVICSVLSSPCCSPCCSGEYMEVDPLLSCSPPITAACCACPGNPNPEL